MHEWEDVGTLRDSSLPPVVQIIGGLLVLRPAAGSTKAGIRVSRYAEQTRHNGKRISIALKEGISVSQVS